MAIAGALVQDILEHDGGREVTVYLPLDAADAVVFAADGGWHTARLAEALEGAGSRTTMLVGVHGLQDDDGRLREYVPGFDDDRFAAHEACFVDDVRVLVRSTFGVDLPPERTAVWGASLGGELALAMGVRHPDIYGAVLSASPCAGYRPPTPLPSDLPRVHLVAGTDEPFFLENAARWADALREADREVVLTERPGEHGGAFWYDEFPAMAAWAFRR